MSAKSRTITREKWRVGFKPGGFSFTLYYNNGPEWGGWQRMAWVGSIVDLEAIALCRLQEWERLHRRRAATSDPVAVLVADVKKVDEEGHQRVLLEIARRGEIARSVAGSSADDEKHHHTSMNGESNA